MSLDRNQVPAAHYAKHITVDVTNGGTGSRVGAQLSSRMPIHVKDEGGNELHGFFTENETNSWKEIFAARARDMVNDPDNRLFAPLYQRAAGKSGTTARLINHVLDAAQVNVKPNQKGKVTIDGINFALETALTKSGRAQMIFRDYVNRAGGDADPLLDSANISSTAKYMTGLLEIDLNAQNMEDTHLSIHSQYLNTSVNKRNNAMSDYAELLGSPDLIAKSVPMTVTRGQQTIHGSFMVNADGLEYDDLKPSKSGFSYLAPNGVTTAKQMEIAPEGMKAISHLQVMDYLCGNVDRHSKNMFYKFDTSDPAKVRLVGVQGIDNDASFGMVEHTQMGPSRGYMSGLDDIKVMDAEQAKAILELTPEQMNEKIRLADLSEEEVLAANQRLADLKDRIARGQIDLISKDADWKRLTEPENFKHLTFDKGIDNGANIFTLMGETITRYNKAPSAFSQKMYTSQPQTTFGKLISLQEDLSLAEQMNNLKAIQEQAKVAQEKIPGIGAVVEKAQEAIDVMEIAMKGIPENQVAGFTMKQLKPSDRNELAGLLQDLADTGNRFADTLQSKVVEQVLNKMETDQTGMRRAKADENYALESTANDSATVNAYRAARNMAAHASNAKQGVLADSMEAEMQLAGKLARDIAARHPERKQGAPTENRMDYDQLKAKLNKVDSRWIHSSRQFKEMLHEFNHLEKTQDYAALSEKAAAYLIYKDPMDNGNGLSDYAKARVQFAWDLKNWAEQRNEDGLTIARFSKNCEDALNKAKNAGSPEEKKQILQDYKEQFQTSYRQMLQISESYPKDRQMQTVCNSFLQNGPIKQYLHAVHSTLSPEEQKTTDIYQAAGLDSNDYFRGKQIDSRQKQLESPVKGAKVMTNPNPQMSK